MSGRSRLRSKAVLPLALVVTIVATVALASTSRATSAGIEQEKQVREFVAAFNDRKIDVMLELTSENIQWMIIDGAKISVETDGKVALRESMQRYFKSCPSCKSSLEWIQIAGSRVTAMEQASWSGKDGPKSQRSLSVYEFRDGKISRVYYFAAEASAGVKKKSE
jgi:hypothetical protein